MTLLQQFFLIFSLSVPFCRPLLHSFHRCAPRRATHRFYCFLVGVFGYNNARTHESILENGRRQFVTIRLIWSTRRYHHQFLVFTLLCRLLNTEGKRFFTTKRIKLKRKQFWGEKTNVVEWRKKNRRTCASRLFGSLECKVCWKCWKFCFFKATFATFAIVKPLILRQSYIHRWDYYYDAYRQYNWQRFRSFACIQQWKNEKCARLVQAQPNIHLSSIYHVKSHSE